ncbi:MAG: TonB-dependent receptor [Bacteroidales bacterium]|nr:TonB-dependent receptor [Bacteroidales bacterium]
MKKILFFILLLGLSVPMIAQVTVQGTVKSAKDGSTLPGVSILQKGTTSGTVTDLNGDYKITVPNNTTLVFSFVGFETKEVAVNGRKTINILLNPTTVGLGEVVVVGYGTVKKSLVTGSISSVTAKSIDNKPITRLDDALQGMTSGVTVAQSSGAPGSQPTIRIRGVTSINNSDPLYVVDGVVMNGGLEYLNPNDIASIEVLKDAASCAIYGARAANGVVLVTTKKGRANTPLQVNYNMQMGIQNVINKVQLANASQYAMLRNEAVMNDGGAPVFTDPNALGAGTNWQNEIFSTAPYQSHSVSVSGGSDNATYYVSAGYIDQKGIVAPSIAYNKRFSLTANTTFKIGKYVTVGEYLGYTYEKNNTGLNTNSEFGGPLSSALNLDPITTPYVSASVGATYPQYALQAGNGMYYGISQYVGQEMTNPLAFIQTQQGNAGYSDNMVGNAYIDVHPIKGLTLKSQINVKKAYWGFNSFTPLFYLNANNSNTNMVVQYRYTNQNLSWNWDNTVEYTKEIGKHDFAILLGTSALETTGSGLNATYQGEPVTNYQDASFNFALPTAQRIAGAYDDQVYTMSSLFGRVTYNYDQKYLFTGILRRDGSSKFGTNNHYGYFPSAQVGWIVNRENFFPKTKVLNNLKIRASYGVVGNDMSLQNFQYESIIAGGGGSNYVFGNDGLAIGYSTSSPANPNLKWEQTSSFDAGFDAILFNSLSVTFDYYTKKTTGMLLQVQIPAFAGYTAQPWSNVGDLTNKGFEIDLGYTKTFGKDFRLNVQGNFAYNKNTVTYLGEGKQYLDGGATFQTASYPITRTAVGQPFGAFYGFEELGVFHSQQEIDNYKDKNGNLIQPNAKPGDFKWADLNGDGKIDQADRTFLGTPIPPYTYGITVNLGYKNWDFMVFGQGVWGNKIFQAYRRLDIVTANYPIQALNAWTVANPNSNYPRMSDSDPNNNFRYPSNFYLQNGAYFRIKTIQLGYSLPKEWMNVVGFKRVRVYASVNNLFTLTKYTGYDPEVGGSSYGIDRGIYPQSRTFMIGLNVGI